MTTEKSTLEQRLDLIRRIQTEGAEAAYKAALEVCQNPKAPAPARATCVTTILRAGGYLATKEDGTAPKQPHEMTPDELQAQIDELRARQRVASDGSSGVFD